MQAITKVFSDIVKPYIDTVKQALTQQINVNGSKNICPFEGTVSRETSGSTSGTMFSLDLAVGDKVTFVCSQDNAMSSNTRNTLQVTLKTDSSVAFREADTENYHLASGLHVLQFTVATAGTYNFTIWTHTLGTATTYSKFMVCDTDIYNVDSSYQPYAMTNRKLTEAVTNQLGDATLAGTYLSDCNNVASSGTFNIYGTSSSTANSPYTTGVETGAKSFVILSRVDTNTNWGMQLAIPMTSVKGIYMRFKASGTWEAWSKITP